MSHPTPYKVSTITCNGSINVTIDTVTLFQNFTVPSEGQEPESGFVWIEYLQQSRGVYPSCKKKREKKNSFDNQVTVLYKYGQKYYPNCKIFQNGNIQMTGIKSDVDGKRVVEAIADEIRRMATSGIVVTTQPIKNIVASDFVIRMINTDFGFKFNIRRKNLHRLLISNAYNNSCSFQPMGYPGVKLQYFWNTMNMKKDGICSCTKTCFGKGTGNGDGQCKKVTIAIFESGNVLITGGNSFAQVDEAYTYITRVVTTNRSEVEKVMAPLLPKA